MLMGEGPVSSSTGNGSLLQGSCLGIKGNQEQKSDGGYDNGHLG